MRVNVIAACYLYKLKLGVPKEDELISGRTFINQTGRKLIKRRGSVQLIYLYLSGKCQDWLKYCILLYYIVLSGFGGLGVACWPLVPKFAGSNPAEAVGFLNGEKILSTPSFGGEVKPSVPCRRFAACKRSLNVALKSTFRQNYRTTFSPTVPTSAAGISHVVADVEAPGGEKWERLKTGGKQWQATPKNLPRMHRTRAIPVA